MENIEINKKYFLFGERACKIFDEEGNTRGPGLIRKNEKIKDLLSVYSIILVILPMY
jgi:hypothetical protein